MVHTGLGASRASDDPRGPLGGGRGEDVRARLPLPLGGGPVQEEGGPGLDGPDAGRDRDRRDPVPRAAVSRSRRSTSAPRSCSGHGPDIPGPVRNEVVAGGRGGGRAAVPPGRGPARGRAPRGRREPAPVAAAPPPALDHPRDRGRGPRGPRAPRPRRGARPTCRRSSPTTAPSPRSSGTCSSTRPATPPTGCRSSSSHGGWKPGSVEIEVLDRGPGFDAGEQELLFEPFYRSRGRGGARERRGARAHGRPAADAGDGRRPARRPARRRRGPVRRTAQRRRGRRRGRRWRAEARGRLTASGCA